MRVFHEYINNSKLPTSKISINTGISEEDINDFKSQERFPTYNDLRKLSKFFKSPISTLLSKVEETPEYNFLFRKSVEEDIDLVVIDKFRKYISNILKINADVKKIVPIREILKPANDNYQSAEILATEFRTLFFSADLQSPLTNLPQLLSHELGFVIKIMEAGSNADGASAFVQDHIFLFVSPRFEGRMLFTLAHELGHILNHHSNENFFYLDKNIPGNFNSSKGYQERFANTFASALLLPLNGIVTMLKKIREINRIPDDSPIGDIEILYIARFYGVSFDVVANRFEHLSLIPEGGSYSLSQKIKKDFGSAEKRANELGLPERIVLDFDLLPPFIIHKAVTLINEGRFSVERMAQMLAIPLNRLIKYHAEFGDH